MFSISRWVAPPLLALAAWTQGGGARDPLARADALERAGDFPGAARELAAVLQRDPNNVPLLSRTAALLSRSDAHDRADELLTTAAALEPTNREVWLQLGEARYRGQRYRPALEAFQKAEALGDADGRARSGLGATQLALGDADAAKELLTQAAKCNARLPGPRFTLGRIALDAGDYAVAIEHFDACLALDDRDAEAWFRRGLAQRRGGNAPEAVASFRRALESDPTHPGARLNLGQVLISLGRADEGRLEIETHGKLARGHQRLTFAMNSLRIDARSPTSRVAVGEALLELGLAGDALVQFREALRSKNPPAAAHLGAARAWKALGNGAEAAACARRALDALQSDAKATPEDLAAARELAGARAESRENR